MGTYNYFPTFIIMKKAMEGLQEQLLVEIILVDDPENLYGLS